MGGMEPLGDIMGTSAGPAMKERDVINLFSLCRAVVAFVSQWRSCRDAKRIATRRPSWLARLEFQNQNGGLAFFCFFLNLGPPD